MSATTYDVTVRLQDAAGIPLADREVTATLVDSGLAKVDGFVTGDESTIVERVDGRTNAAGTCVLTLVANADITPANTYYAIRADGQTAPWLIAATASDDVQALLVANPDDLGSAFALDNLADVTAPSPTTGHALAWNGTAWVPTNMGTQVELDAEAAARVAGDALNLAKASNLSDLASALTARTNLGLGGAAVLSVGTAAGTVAAGDDSRLSNARTPTAHASSHAGAGADPITSLGAVSFTGGISLTGTASVADRKLTMQSTQVLYLPKVADFPNCLFYGNGGGSLAAGASALTAVGVVALNANTTGASNTAVGVAAMATNTTASRNTAVGDSALYSSNSSYNAAVGYAALSNVTSGATNVGLGYAAGSGITTGSGNTVLGASITGLAAAAANLTLVGYTAGASSTALSATWVGTASGASATADYSAGLGRNAGKNMTGGYSTAVGYTAGEGSTGAYGTFVGMQAGNSATGIASTGVGAYAANANTGTSVTAIGMGAGSTNAYNEVILLGRDAMPTAANQFVVGSTVYPANKWIPGHDTDTYLDIATANTWKVYAGGAQLLQVDSVGLTVVASTARLKFGHADQAQTTVGAAGGASALPATPTKYFKVKDSGGTEYVIPAYAAS